MKPSELKTIIKEACREAFREEMKDILLEAIKSPKTIVQETKQIVKENKQSETPKTEGEKREAYMSLMKNMIEGKSAFTTEDLPNQQSLGPIPMDTIGEGSSLPQGEVPLNLIRQLTGGK